MKQTLIISSGFIAIILATWAGVSWYQHNYGPINNFSDCEKASHPIQNSNPRVCSVGVKRFVEQ